MFKLFFASTLVAVAQGFAAQTATYVLDGEAKMSQYINISVVPEECRAVPYAKVPDSCCYSKELPVLPPEPASQGLEPGNCWSGMFKELYDYSCYGERDCPGFELTYALFSGCDAQGVPTFGQNCAGKDGVHTYLYPVGVDGKSYQGNYSDYDKCGIGCKFHTKGSGCFQMGTWSTLYQFVQAIEDESLKEATITSLAAEGGLTSHQLFDILGAQTVEQYVYMPPCKLVD